MLNSHVKDGAILVKRRNINRFTKIEGADDLPQLGVTDVGLLHILLGQAGGT